jgi:hypothetical protein
MPDPGAHPEQFEAAYWLGYERGRRDMAALLTQRGQAALVGLIADVLNSPAPPPEKAGVPDA